MTNIDIESKTVVYINSCFFSVATMVTAGMIPTNDTIEKVYSMFLMVLLSVNIVMIYIFR